MSPSNAGTSDEGATKRKRAPRSKRSTAPGEGPKPAEEPAPAEEPSPAKEPAPAKNGARQVHKAHEVTVSRETVVRRVAEARGTSLVICVARAAVGVIITLIIGSIVAWVLYAMLPLFGNSFMATVVTAGVMAALVIGARLAAVRSLPAQASSLGFLADRVFVWVDPFREERPHLLPMWLEAVLWAPSQILAGGVPFRRIRHTGQADAEAAADVARTLAEEMEMDLSNGLPSGSAQARGLRLLLLLRLARLVIEDGKLKGRISGLGQAALFEGTVG